MPHAQEYLKQFDSDKESITTLNLSDSKLTGELNLKGFINLTRLVIDNNQITSLDVQDCLKLTHLNIQNNPTLSVCYVYDLSKLDRLLSSTGELENNNFVIGEKYWVSNNLNNPNIYSTRIIPTKRHMKNASVSSLNSNDSHLTIKPDWESKLSLANKKLKGETPWETWETREGIKKWIKELEIKINDNKQSKIFNVEFEFLPLIPAKSEPEYQLAPNLLISSVGIGYSKALAKSNMLPPGSAFKTSSGDLESETICGIIHAAPGSLSQEGEGKPNRQAIIRAVQNSIILAEREGDTKLAIPFIGSKIFLSAIGDTKEQLAEAIIKTAISQKKSLEKIVFVPYGEEDKQIFEKVWKQIKSQYSSEKLLGIEIKEGDITKYATHNCPVIVNAANMEGTFGAGLSGIIGQATKQSVQINHEAHYLIKKFNQIILIDRKKASEWLMDGKINQVEYELLESNFPNGEYSITQIKESLLVERWKNISLAFHGQPNLIKEWTDKGFNYQQTEEWINIGLQVNQADYASWLKNQANLTPVEVLNNSNSQELEEKYQKYTIEAKKNIEEYKTQILTILDAWKDNSNGLEKENLKVIIKILDNDDLSSEEQFDELESFLNKFPNNNAKFNNLVTSWSKITKPEYQTNQKVNVPNKNRSLWTNPWTYGISGAILILFLLGWWVVKKVYK